MSGPPGDGDFERWLEAELRRTLSPQRGPKPLAGQAAYRQPRRSARRLATLGVVAAALVVCAVLGEGVGAAATGTPNPVEWSEHAVRAFQHRAGPRPGGPDVRLTPTPSSIPVQPPSVERSDAGGRPSTPPSQSDTSGKAHGGQGNGNAQGHRKSKPSPRASKPPD